jgi:hypothetical protein
MEGAHQEKRINVQGWAKTGLHSMVCLWRHWCLVARQLRHHRLLSFDHTRERRIYQHDKQYLEREDDILL